MSGESGTSHTGNIHYYYICLSKRKRKKPCDTKAVHKQYLEDTVINATVKMLNTPDNISKIAKTILLIHEKETNNNSALRILTKKREEAVKASNNIIKAIEQGIITELTKTRMKELEREIMQYDFDIEQEKQKSYSYLTVEEIEVFLKSKVFDDPNDIKIRKLLINTFVREVILYPDKIIITYNFTDVITPHKITPETVNDTERQITSALSLHKGSYIFPDGAPTKKELLSTKSSFFVYPRRRLGISLNV